MCQKPDREGELAWAFASKLINTLSFTPGFIPVICARKSVGTVSTVFSSMQWNEQAEEDFASSVSRETVSTVF